MKPRPARTPSLFRKWMNRLSVRVRVGSPDARTMPQSRDHSGERSALRLMRRSTTPWSTRPARASLSRLLHDFGEIPRDAGAIVQTRLQPLRVGGNLPGCAVERLAHSAHAGEDVAAAVTGQIRVRFDRAHDVRDHRRARLDEGGVELERGELVHRETLFRPSVASGGQERTGRPIREYGSMKTPPITVGLSSRQAGKPLT